MDYTVEFSTAFLYSDRLYLWHGRYPEVTLIGFVTGKEFVAFRSSSESYIPKRKRNHGIMKDSLADPRAFSHPAQAREKVLGTSLSND